MPRAVQMLDILITTHPTMTATQTIPTNLILFSKFFMTIILTVIIVTHLCIFYLINECIAPVADIFANIISKVYNDEPISPDFIF